jgi:hypothetical protein
MQLNWQTTSKFNMVKGQVSTPHVFVYFLATRERILMCTQVCMYFIQVRGG